MTNEQGVADVVRKWVKQQLPHDQGGEGRAPEVAVRSYNSGATFGEACHQASDFVGSWSRHPAHWKVDQDAVVRFAS